MNGQINLAANVSQVVDPLAPDLLLHVGERPLDQLPRHRLRARVREVVGGGVQAGGHVVQRLLRHAHDAAQLLDHLR